MLSFLPGWLLLPFSFSLFALNLALWGILVTPLGIIKLLLPFKAVHRVTAVAGKGCQPFLVHRFQVLAKRHRHLHGWRD